MTQPDPRFVNVPAVVAVPARDEMERIADCLLALDGQDGPAPGVLLLVNNTTDATVARVADLAPALRCPVRVIEHVFPQGSANAGQARRMAMAEADARAPDGAPLLTTDADGRVEPGWLAANLRHLRRGEGRGVRPRGDRPGGRKAHPPGAARSRRPGMRLCGAAGRDRGADRPGPGRPLAAAHRTLGGQHRRDPGGVPGHRRHPGRAAG